MENVSEQLANLTIKREKWVAANRENGFEDGITNLLTELYPDNAHFIYELLQNAEDTHATTVSFELSDNAIRFKHDGQRLFNLKDVVSITSIGVSNKRNDPTNIGKFGVGFKAVFAYTNTPEIHSGEFHFRISNLVVPEPLPHLVADNTTVFHLPFDNPKKHSTRAVEEIERGLCALTDNALLFLSNIREIQYLLPNGQSGKLRRADGDAKGIGQHVEIHAIHPGGEETVSNWLRYSREVSVADEAGKMRNLVVAIAFRLEMQKEESESHPNDAKKDAKKVGEPKTKWRIVPCDPGQVSIFFPAEKETSNLEFHLHAPFASTVARDSVRDCDANDDLCAALAELTSAAMADIRSRGLLTMSFLAVLPNDADGLPKFYQPIRDAIVKTFQEQDLLPTKIGSHRKSSDLYCGPAEISAVVDDDDLSMLTGDDAPLWAANAPQKGQREDRFLESLNIREWEWESLKNAIQETEQSKQQKRKLEKWISEKPDNWLMRFYALMESCHLETESYYDSVPLCAWASLEGIRVIDHKGSVEHVRPCDAYFPQHEPSNGKNGTTNVPAKIRLVKTEVYEKGRLGERTKKAARDFLERVGVREYDERAEIERRLERYSKPGEKTISENHYRDIRSFVGFFNRNPSDVTVFNGISFLVAMEDGTSKAYVRPEDIVLDDPYEDTGLGELAAKHGKRKLWPDYLEHLGKNSREDFISFLKAVGVLHQLEVTQCDCCDNERIAISLGDRVTITGLNADWTIENIVDYLSQRKAALSRLIWMALLRASREAATAKYQINQRRNRQVAASQLVQHLASSAWIPDRHGSFFKPEDMTRDMLREDFPYDDRNGLLTAIGFGHKEKEAGEEFKALDAAAKKFGLASAQELEEALELLKAKREGRIREIREQPESGVHVSKTSASIRSTGDDGQSSVSRIGDPSESETAIGEPHPRPSSASGEARTSPILQRIRNRIRNSGNPTVAGDTSIGEDELPEDNDDYSPTSVDYRRKIERAEERNATEIAQLEREQDLLDKANSVPRYSYGWFLALLEVECMASCEKNANGKTISIGFGKIESDDVSSRAIVLKEPDHFIPQSIEEFSGVRVDFCLDDGRTGKFHIESFAAKEFSLLGRLRSVDELNGVDLAKVVAARIDVQNPSFLLQALLERFTRLGFDDEFDMKGNLTRDIEFVFGPPGTGKTTHLAEKVLIPMMRGAQSCRVLVLTPTNKAADVLTMRIIDKMGADNSYKKWLVRFGTSIDARIEAAGVWRDRGFDIGPLERFVTITTIARFAYDGFASKHEKSNALDEIEWDAIVIDEASMIPLINIAYPLYQRRPRKFIIAGDPFQIEPIVAVEQWKEENIYALVGLNKPGSFADPRTEPHAYPVMNLETQYRSIPAIGDVFSQFTYNGILKHHRPAGAQRELRVEGMDISPLNLIKFPVSKYESIYRAKRLNSGTPYQTYSALFTFEFVRWLAGQIQNNHAGEPPFRIGIIAPYRAQANLLSKLNDSWAATNGAVQIQVGTIHGFQGDECDIIIAVLNPPPTISTSPQMFLNKQNILNVAISRARDYLFILMPNRETEGVDNLRKVARIENLVRGNGALAEYTSHAVEEVILGSARYLEENTFSTGHQMVNVYLKPERYYEVRSDNSAIDVQIHEKR